MKKTLRLMLMLAMIALPFAVRADEYAPPKLENFVLALARFGAIDLNDDLLLDEYAFINECPLVKEFYADDFKWNKVRGAMRESVRLNAGTFPTAFSHVAKIQLDRFDFNNRLFRFTEKSAVRNVNSISFEKENNVILTCAGHAVKFIPISYRAVLDAPLTIEGLPMPEADAAALLERMKAAGNTDRIIRARFNMRVTYIEPLRKSMPGEALDYRQNGMSGASRSRILRLDTRLDSVEFFEDENLTRMVYSYRP